MQYSKSVKKLKRRILLYSIIGVFILSLIISVLVATYYIGKYKAVIECCNPRISYTCVSK